MSKHPKSSRSIDSASSNNSNKAATESRKGLSGYRDRMKKIMELSNRVWSFAQSADNGGELESLALQIQNLADDAEPAPAETSKEIR